MEETGGNAGLELIIHLIVFIGPIIVFYIPGRIAERVHYKSIQTRELTYIEVPVITHKRIPYDNVRSVEMVSGSAVISLDHFKRFLASLRNLVGGRVGSYESLLDRARREAILRMKSKCPDADMIVNLRLENSSVGKSADNKKQIGCIEVLAYGTAVYLNKG